MDTINTKEILLKRYFNIKKNIEDVKSRYSIKDNIEIVAVTKYTSINIIEDFLSLNTKSPLAESKAQSLRDRASTLKNETWHFIGQIQSNKIKYIAEYSSLIHSVDKLEIAEEISQTVLKKNKTIDILLEFNLSKEEQKGGFSIENYKHFYEKTISLANINVRGVMGMASYTDDTTKIEHEFESLREIFENIKSEYKNISFDTISMGMSGDYLLAIKHGSNMVRIGSSLFEGLK